MPARNRKLFSIRVKESEIRYERDPFKCHACRRGFVNIFSLQRHERENPQHQTRLAAQAPQGNVSLTERPIYSQPAPAQPLGVAVQAHASTLTRGGLYCSGCNHRPFKHGRALRQHQHATGHRGLTAEELEPDGPVGGERLFRDGPMEPVWKTEYPDHQRIIAAPVKDEEFDEELDEYLEPPSFARSTLPATFRFDNLASADASVKSEDAESEVQGPAYAPLQLRESMPIRSVAIRQEPGQPPDQSLELPVHIHNAPATEDATLVEVSAPQQLYPATTGSSDVSVSSRQSSMVADDRVLRTDSNWTQLPQAKQSKTEIALRAARHTGDELFKHGYRLAMEEEIIGTSPVHCVRCGGECPLFK